MCHLLRKRVLRRMRFAQGIQFGVSLVSILLPTREIFLDEAVSRKYVVGSLFSRYIDKDTVKFESDGIRLDANQKLRHIPSSSNRVIRPPSGYCREGECPAPSNQVRRDI